MSHQLFFLCPNCLAEDQLIQNRCENCNTEIDIQPYSVICAKQQFGVAEYYQFLKENLSVDQPAHFRSTDAFPDALRVSDVATLRQGITAVAIRGYRGWFNRTILAPEKIAEGHLIFEDDALRFISPEKQWHFPATEITAITTDSHYLEFKRRGEPFFHIHFHNESALKYEILLRKWLQQNYSQLNLGDICEFQPHIRTTLPKPGKRIWQISPGDPPPESAGEKIGKKLIAALLRLLLRPLIRIRFEGLENWQPNMPGFVLVNHQSALDPFIVTAFLNYRVAFLTKASAFTHTTQRKFLQWVMGIPTTRYQHDPAVIRDIKTMLQHGVKVGVFPEAERCWNGKLQPFKYGLVKTIMASQTPVFCIQLENVFDFWPRWSSLPRRAKVVFRIHPPFCLLPEITGVDEQRQFLESIFSETQQL